MSATYFTLLTAAGEAALATATALGSALRLTQMAVGDGNGELPTPDTRQTRLINERHRAPLNSLSVDPDNPGQIIAEQVLPEQAGGWWIREIGLYDEQNRLIAVGNCPPTYKPQLTEGSARTQIIRMVLIVSHTETVELKIDPAVVLATRQYVDESLTRHTQTRNHPDATLTAKGLVQLSNDINSTSETLAATPKAVKTAYDRADAAYNKPAAALPNASTSRAGIVQLTDSVTSQSTLEAATGRSVRQTYLAATRSASTSEYGQVRLSNDINSTSQTTAATPYAVSRAYSRADNAFLRADGAYSRADNAFLRADGAYSRADRAVDMATRAGRGDRTLLFRGDIGAGNISLSGNPGAFDEVVVIGSDDSNNWIGIHVIPVCHIAAAPSMSNKLLCVFSMEHMAWYVATESFATTTWRTGNRQEDCRIREVWGVDYV